MHNKSDGPYLVSEFSSSLQPRRGPLSLLAISSLTSYLTYLRCSDKEHACTMRGLPNWRLSLFIPPLLRHLGNKPTREKHLAMLGVGGTPWRIGKFGDYSENGGGFSSLFALIAVLFRRWKIVLFRSVLWLLENRIFSAVVRVFDFYFFICFLRRYLFIFVDSIFFVWNCLFSLIIFEIWKRYMLKIFFSCWELPNTCQNFS